MCCTSCDIGVKEKGENRQKMTRYGVFLILERGWVSLPEGLQQGMSSFFFFFSFLLLVSVVAPLCTPVFSATLGFL